MEDVPLALSLLRVANFAAAGYLLYLMLSMRKATNDALFSRALFLLSLAIGLYFVGEIVAILDVIPDSDFMFYQALFTFLFMVLLFYSLTHMRRDMLAYEHLIKRKERRRSSFVD
jgi:hypothetical protein